MLLLYGIMCNQNIFCFSLILEKQNINSKLVRCRKKNGVVNNGFDHASLRFDDAALDGIPVDEAKMYIG